MILGALGAGFALGLRHALDADHVAAVSTIVSDKKGRSQASLIGAFWGAGHAASLFFFGSAILLLKLRVPQGVESALEAGVGLMLLVLGAQTVRNALRDHKIHAHGHAHDAEGLHVHLHAHPRQENAHDAHRHSHAASLLSALITRLRERPKELPWRSLAIGMVHGLAGSAGLALLVVSSAPSLAAGFAYMLAFGLGATLGMLVLSNLLTLPITTLGTRFSGLQSGVQFAAGLASFGVGVWILASYVP